MISVLLMMVNMIIGIDEIKHTMFELFCCMSLEWSVLFSCISNETDLYDAPSIQENTVTIEKMDKI